MDTGPVDPQIPYLHVRVLLGMVVGLALTHLLRGVARMLERPKHRRYHWIHLAWVLWMFIYLLDFWWWQMGLDHLMTWKFRLLMFLVLYALILYLLSVLLFPESLDEYLDYREYLLSRGPWFFGLLAVMFAVDLYDTWIKGREYFQSLGVEYLVRNAAYIVLCCIALRTRNGRFHGVFVIAALIHQVSWLSRLYNIE